MRIKPTQFELNAALRTIFEHFQNVSLINHDLLVAIEIFNIMTLFQKWWRQFRMQILR